MQFETVFDAAQTGYTTWPFAAFGLVFVLIGYWLVFHAGLPGRFGKYFSRFFFGFAIFWTLTSFILTYFDYILIQRAVSTGQYKTVEGIVSNFVPLPPSGKGTESFTVNGVPFRYSDYLLTNAFNTSALHGEPIHEGVYVRISFIGRDKIVKLEVAKDTSNQVKTR